MHLHLAYGRTGLHVDLPDDANVHVLRTREKPALADPDAAVRDAIASPIGCPPLREIARGRSTAAITISDITRPVPNATILAPILDALNDAGIPDHGILIVVGTGLHRPNTPDEICEMVGDDIVQRVEIVNHVARDESTLAHLGKTSRGTPVWLNRAFLDADIHIATSLIEPHLMAGFSGGRKAVCPGLAGVATMRVMHGPDLLSHPRACEGVLKGNPFHEQASEIARMARVDFTVNAALSGAREMVGVFAGDLDLAHAEGCQFVASQCIATLPKAADIVVTTSAGYPLDLTFYQSVKAMTAALPAVKQGGTIVVASACGEGIGSPEFTQLLRETPSVDAFRGRLADPRKFVIDQWQLQEMCKALDRADMRYVTHGLDDDTVRDLLVTPAPSVEAAVEEALDRHGRDALIAVMPEGPYVMPRVAADVA